MNNINWWNTEFDQKEIDAISYAISSRKIGMGSITKEFEDMVANLLNVPYVVATPSGSAALYISLMVLGIGYGDEVIVPDRTFIATAHAVQLTGAKVILVDCNERDTNIDISKIEDKITSQTKAIIPVHLNGRAVDMYKINLIAKKYELFVLEDSCQAFFSKNSKNKYLGTLSDIGSFSLGLAKLITVGFGGFVVTSNKNYYDKLLKFRNHGRFDNEHINYDTLGFNFKVSDMIMSLGLTQLKKYQQKIEHCKNIYKLYQAGLKKLDFIDLVAVNIKYEVPIYIEVVSKYREAIIKYLKQNNININFLPPSLHLSKHLQQKDNDYKNSMMFYQESFILPCGPNQSITNIVYVINKINEFRYE